MSKTKPKKKIVSRSLLTIAFGSALVIIPSFWYLNQADLSFSKTPETSANEIVADKEKKPRVLKISKIKVKLIVEQGSISNEKWIVSENGVTHFEDSANPGGNGNIVIYGHNKKNLLGSLAFLSVGDEISLINGENKEFKYKVKSIETVSPDTVEVINPTSTEILTIYTCTGLFDSKRLVVIADPVQVKLLSDEK